MRALIGVEATAGLAPAEAGGDHLFEDGTRRVQSIATLLVHGVENFVGRVESDEIEKGERAHGVTTAKAHCRVNILARGIATSGELTTVRTTSTNLRTGAGLKKCSPTTWSGRPVATAISVTDNDDVLVARIASAGQMASRASKIERFRSRLSVTASMTRSRSPKSSRLLLNLIRPRVVSRSSSEILPRLSARASEVSI